MIIVIRSVLNPDSALKTNAVATIRINKISFRPRSSINIGLCRTLCFCFAKIELTAF